MRENFFFFFSNLGTFYTSTGLVFDFRLILIWNNVGHIHLLLIFHTVVHLESVWHLLQLQFPKAQSNVTNCFKHWTGKQWSSFGVQASSLCERKCWLDDWQMEDMCSMNTLLSFLFLRSCISNPDIFSWIITFHHIILRLGNRPPCSYASVASVTQDEQEELQVSKHCNSFNRSSLFYDWRGNASKRFSVQMIYSEALTCFKIYCSIIYLLSILAHLLLLVLEAAYSVWWDWQPFQLYTIWLLKPMLHFSATNRYSMPCFYLLWFNICALVDCFCQLI